MLFGAEAGDRAYGQEQWAVGRSGEEGLAELVEGDVGEGAVELRGGRGRRYVDERAVGGVEGGSPDVLLVEEVVARVAVEGPGGVEGREGEGHGERVAGAEEAVEVDLCEGDDARTGSPPPPPPFLLGARFALRRILGSGAISAIPGDQRETGRSF